MIKLKQYPTKGDVLIPRNGVSYFIENDKIEGVTNCKMKSGEWVYLSENSEEIQMQWNKSLLKDFLSWYSDGNSTENDPTEIINEFLNQSKI